jgi:hypothetical protein
MVKHHPLTTVRSNAREVPNERCTVSRYTLSLLLLAITALAGTLTFNAARVRRTLQAILT